MVFGCKRFRVVPESFLINNCIMSETYRWAALDNSDAIEIKDLGVDISVGTSKGDKYNLLKSKEFKALKRYNIEDASGMYDSWKDSVNSVIKPGNYYGFKIAANYFKSGTIKTINLLNQLQNSSSYNAANKAFDTLVIAVMKDNKYTIVDYATAEFFASGENFDEFYKEEHLNKGWKRSLFVLENGISLKIDENGYNILDDSNAALLFFAPRDKTNLSIREQWPIGKEFTHDDFITLTAEDIINGSNESFEPNFYPIRIVCLYRSLNDASSFLYETSGNILTASQKSSNSAPDYIPYLWYDIEINIISDHVEGNFNNYHLKADEVNEISLTKYNAPFIPSLSKINAANATWSDLYLSDKSLRGITYSDSRRVSKFELIGKQISAISIPLNYTYPWLEHYLNYYRTGLENSINDDYGILYLPMFLEIKTSENGEWHRSTNAIAQNSPRLATNFNTFSNKIIDWTFKFDNVLYEGGGLYIRVVNAERTYFDSIPSESEIYRRLHVAELAISYYQAAILNEADYINFSYRSNTAPSSPITNKLNITAPIKVYFDYNLRAAWNDLIENHIAENELIKYETFNTADIAVINNLATPGSNDIHHANTWILSGDYSPQVTNNFYLNTITLYTKSTSNPSLDNSRQYYLMIEVNGRKYCSINSLYLHSNMQGIIPTWIFDINDEIVLDGSQITIGLVYTNDTNNETFTSVENGLQLNQYIATGSGCFMKRNGKTEEYLGEIYFGFKFDKIKIIESKIENLEAALSNHLS